MPVWPAGYAQVSVKGTFKTFSNVPRIGSVVIYNETLVVDTTGEVIIPVFRETYELDAEGFFETILLASDDPRLAPQGFTYHVILNFIGGGEFNIRVPADSPGGVLDLSRAIEVEASNGTIALEWDLAGSAAVVQENLDEYETVTDDRLAALEQGESAAAVQANLDTYVAANNTRVTDVETGLDTYSTSNDIRVTNVETNVDRAKAAITVDEFMGQTGTVAIEHRGGGMLRPEHTLKAYETAVAGGAKAIEVSVNVSADGTLWCLHDLTMERTTYSTGALNTFSDEEIINTVLTNGRLFHGQGWTDQRMVPLREVLDRFIGKVVIFLEAKGNDAVVPLQNLLKTFYPSANSSVVWKCHIGTNTQQWAKDNGFRVWVYMDNSTVDATLNAKDSLVDYWGVQSNMPTTRISEIVARGKPVICWPVYRRDERDFLTALGVKGLMTSDRKYVQGNVAVTTATKWTTQIKDSGGTPCTDYDQNDALKFDDAPNLGWVFLNSLPNKSYGLGKPSPIALAAGGYKISFSMKFEGLPADMTQHSGIYFGKVSDDRYQFNTANKTAGYHAVMRANGNLELYRHLAGIVTGTRISGIIPTTQVVAGQAMTFEVHVTTTTVELKRTDGIGWTTGPIVDNTLRGGYWGLSCGSISILSAKAHWFGARVDAL